MYAIVEIAGQQFKVAKDQKVFVHRLATEEGKAVAFDNVLLIGDGDKVTIGAPAIDGAQVGAKVLKHLKGDKVIVFKKKRRKGYQKKNGHRQSLKKIEGIGPKIAETLAAAGIVTFADVAKATPAAISEIIADVRGNHVTDTWPAQAQLAADGKWDELKKWQDELDGGKA